MRELRRLQDQLREIANDIHYYDRRLGRLYETPMRSDTRRAERVRLTEAKKRELEMLQRSLRDRERVLLKMQDVRHAITRRFLSVGAVVLFSFLHFTAFQIMQEPVSRQDGQDFAAGYAIFLIGSVFLTLGAFSYKK